MTAAGDREVPRSSVAMKGVGESCGAQTAEAEEATSTGASVSVIRERGAEKLTTASAEMGAADPSNSSFSATLTYC